MGDLNRNCGAKADKKIEKRRADKPPPGLVSERRGGRVETDVRTG